MKVTGFTFVRNAVKYDYPVVEAIRSILPLCDEVIVSVGNSDDGTLALIESVGSPKVKIFHSVWDDSLKAGGRILAVETDKAYAHISPDTTWAFYIQGDEVVHEDDYPVIRAAMEKYKDDQRVEGLLFNYRHFYGSYDYVGDSRTWYNKEIRIVRYNPEVRSYRDAQGFRLHDRKLNVKPVAAWMHHYGWVKHPAEQAKKLKNSISLYFGEDKNALERHNIKEAFDYAGIDSLNRFSGKHPAVMQERIDRKNWQFDFDISRKNFKNMKRRLLYWVEQKTGKRLFDYRNYKLLK
ncbi:glycosyltransferase family 2 protein [Chitinophaga lutea]